MGRLITSFGIGFATAAVIGVAVAGLMRPAEAREYSLGDWVQMAPEAKVEHARQVAGDGPMRMQDARAIMFCLHDAARATPAITSLGLNDAVEACRTGLGG